jgi:hypothetical protein
LGGSTAGREGLARDEALKRPSGEHGSRDGSRLGPLRGRSLRHGGAEGRARLLLKEHSSLSKEVVVTPPQERDCSPALALL